MNDNEIEDLLIGIKKNVKQHGWAFWLGFSISMFGGIYFWNLAFWLILIPAFALFAWREN